MVSNKEIITSFVKNAPPTELGAVVKSVKGLVGEDDLNEVLQESCMEHNVANHTPVKVPDCDHSVVLTKYNQKDTTHFSDPISGKVLEVDNHKQTVLGSEDGEKCENKYVLAMQPIISDYCADHYPDGAGSVFEQDGDQVVVCIHAVSSNKKSFWSGGWTSSFEVEFKDEKAAKVKGDVANSVHYYEDGNVKAISRHKFEDSVEGSDLKETVKKVMAAIDSMEGKFHSRLDMQCVELVYGGVKQLRRKLPFTQTLFDFRGAQHKLAGELSKKDGK